MKGDQNMLGVVPREIWLKRRAAELACAIHVAIAISPTDADVAHDTVQQWIDQLQDLWQLIEG
ncbi:MAG TPA: hypothetical protein VIW64_12655 [Pyrinomonadaceae bacterium]|jgi:hypothetical protein